MKGRNNTLHSLYGISQNPDTKDYIMVLQDEYCERCGEEYGEEYTDIYLKWCKPCQTDYLKNNFTNWSSGNEKIDNHIQKMQLKINDYDDTILEWISYNQFDNIKEINKNDFSTVFSAIWKDNSPLKYNRYKKLYKRNLKNQNQIVSLKCFKGITDEFFNEV